MIEHNVFFSAGHASFFFNDTATTEIYTLSLHDALPICSSPKARCTGGIQNLRGEADSSSACLRLLSVVIHIVNVKRVGVGKAENPPPVCSNRDRPKPLELAFERMQPKAWHIHIGHATGSVEPRENIEI